MKATTIIPQSPAIHLIDEERKRQIREEGFSVASDIAVNPNGELAAAAACYAMPKNWSLSAGYAIEKLWPWGNEWYKPKPDDRKREIIVACALLVAEYDLLLAMKKNDTYCIYGNK